jgi:hypothetical protein
VRGCRNCCCYDAQASLCRLDNNPVTKTPHDFCGQWRWLVNPQQTWTSAFSGLELLQAAEACLEEQLTRAVADCEDRDPPPPLSGRPRPTSKTDLWEHI